MHLLRLLAKKETTFLFLMNKVLIFLHFFFFVQHSLSSILILISVFQIETFKCRDQSHPYSLEKKKFDLVVEFITVWTRIPVAPILRSLSVYTILIYFVEVIIHQSIVVLADSL